MAKTYKLALVEKNDNVVDAIRYIGNINAYGAEEVAAGMKNIYERINKFSKKNNEFKQVI